MDLSTFVDNPFVTEKIWVGLRASNGDPAGRLLLTFKFIEQSPEQALATNRARNVSTDSADSAPYGHGNPVDHTYGNLFVGLPNMVVHKHRKHRFAHGARDDGPEAPTCTHVH